MRTRFAILAGLVFLGTGVSCAENHSADIIESISRPADNTFVDNGAPMSVTVNLWAAGNIPVATRNANNSDGPDFIPNLEVFTVADDVHDIADILTSMTGKEKMYDLYGRPIRRKMEFILSNVAKRPLRY